MLQNQLQFRGVRCPLFLVMRNKALLVGLSGTETLCTSDISTLTVPLDSGYNGLGFHSEVSQVVITFDNSNVPLEGLIKVYLIISYHKSTN